LRFCAVAMTTLFFLCLCYIIICCFSSSYAARATASARKEALKQNMTSYWTFINI